MRRHGLREDSLALRGRPGTALRGPGTQRPGTALRGPGTWYLGTPDEIEGVLIRPAEVL